VTVSQWLLTLISYAVLLLLLWLGRRTDRWAAVALLAVQTLTPALATFEVGGVRIGVAIASLLLTIALVTLALLGRRWWLVLAAASQLVVLASWINQLANPETQVWAGVTFRIIIWMELMALAAFGVLEARNAPYAAERP
jgi:hypothetical protein